MIDTIALIVVGAAVASALIAAVVAFAVVCSSDFQRGDPALPPARIVRRG